MPNTPDIDRPNDLSVALIVPNGARRKALIAALDGTRCTIAQEFSAYPSRDDLPKIARLDCDVVIVDLDDDLEQAVHVIANICSYIPSVIAMACSSRNDSTLLRRSMQAGAREFLAEPFVPEALGEAFARAASRRPDQKKAAGKALVFAPAKGGVGVTTTALNFALALVKESGAKVVIVDMDFQLGEVAPGLGMTATFSIVDALMSATRIDRDFLETALIRHSSGLAVLGAPENYSFVHLGIDEGAKKLFRILREEFDYVVVDSGPCYGDVQEMLFEMADTLYLVTEMTFPSLRNAHRMISFLSARDESAHVQVVANRYDSQHGRTDEAGSHGKIDEASAVKALSRPVSWKIPNAYAAVRDAQDRGVPVAMQDSPYTRAVVRMATVACGKSLTVVNKTSRTFNFFGLRRGAASPART
jgi:pilus assembly protein CpaE